MGINMIMDLIFSLNVCIYLSIVYTVFCQTCSETDTTYASTNTRIVIPLTTSPLTSTGSYKIFNKGYDNTLVNVFYIGGTVYPIYNNVTQMEILGSMVDGNFTFIISKFTPDLQGNFTLSGPGNVLLDCKIVYAIVNIISVVMTTPLNDTVSVIENTTATFTCESSGGLPAANVTWFKDTTQLTGAVSTVTVEGDLKVTKSKFSFTPTRSDQGTRISCRASNVGTEHVSARKPILDILYPPSTNPLIIGFNQGQRYRAIKYFNTSQQLTYTISDGNPRPTLSWNCYQGSTITNTTAQSVSSTIIWMAGDAGRTCTCIASHELSSNVRSVSVDVEVMHPPNEPTLNTTSTGTCNSLQITEGHSMSVTCNSVSNPPLDKYTWTLPDGTTIEGQTLHVQHVKVYFNNVYTCTAQNTMMPSIGNMVVGSNSSSLTLLLSFAPRLDPTTHNKSYVTAIEGSSATIHISVLAFPIPKSYSYVWKKCESNICTSVESYNIVVNSVGLESSLIFSHIGNKDFGRYRISVSNEVGEFIHMFVLQRQENDNESGTGINGVVIGGVVGGCLLLLIIAAIILVVIYKRRNRKDTSTQQSDNNRDVGAYDNLNMPDRSEIDRGNRVPIHDKPTDEIGERPTAVYSGLAQYGNMQATYEELDAR